MYKFFGSTILVLIIAVAACNGEAPRFRSSLKVRQGGRRGLLARQESAPAAEAAPTPYPSAAELKPEVPFDETVGDHEPDLTYGPPDLTYGPPEFDLRPAVEEQLPSEDAPEEFAPPADAEEFSSAEVTTESGISSRLTSRRRQQRVVFGSSSLNRKQLISSRLRLAKIQRQRLQRLQKKQRLVKTQRLTALHLSPVVAPAAAPAAHPASVVSAAPLQTQQYFVVNQPFAYTAQYQSW